MNKLSLLDDKHKMADGVHFFTSLLKKKNNQDVSEQYHFGFFKIIILLPEAIQICSALILSRCGAHVHSSVLIGPLFHFRFSIPSSCFPVADVHTTLNSNMMKNLLKGGIFDSIIVQLCLV